MLLLRGIEDKDYTQFSDALPSSSTYLQPVDDCLRVFVRLRFSSQIPRKGLRIISVCVAVRRKTAYLALRQCVKDCLLDPIGMLIQPHMLQHHYTT